MTIETRKDFVKNIMEITRIDDFQRADEITRAVIKLVQQPISETLARQIAESVSPDLKKGWNMISTNNAWGELEPFDKRKDFLMKVMEIAGIDDFRLADEIAQLVIKLIQESIGEALTTEIADFLPPDLKKGWNIIASTRKGLYV